MQYIILNTFKEKRINSNKTDYYYLVKTPYGLCKTLKYNWDKGHKPNISSALNKTEYFINMCNEIHNNKYNYSSTIYVNRQTKIKIICNIHGEFLQNPVDHLLGNGCRKCSGKDKTTEDFIIQANSIHNNRYEYEKSIYVKSNNKLIITCKLHGDFNQLPTSHLTGVGCPTCGKDSINGNVWSDSKWKEMAKNSKYFDSFKVYILECYDDEEKFYKIGKTYTTVNKRFSGKKMPYNYKIIKQFVFTDSKNCCMFEKQLHNKYKQFRYKPLKHFNGSNECFDYNSLIEEVSLIDDKSN